MQKVPQMNNKIAIATGGTGGHVFPAQALAEKLKEKGIAAVLISDSRTEKFLKGALKELESLTCFSTNFSSGSFAKKMIGIIRLLFSILQIIVFLKKQKVTKVIGFGGYITLPTLFAAKLLRLTIFMHDQNAVIGRVNRLFLPFAETLFTSFPEVQKVKPKYKSKLKFTGNLVRSEVLKIAKVKKVTVKEKIVLAIIGGSQGASVFARIAKVISLLSPKLLKNLKIYHQVKVDDLRAVQEIYKSYKIEADVAPFFENIGEILQESDLVIARAGASTVFELTALGKPSVLIPYKYAMDNHQYYNAKYLSDNGAAELLDESKLETDLLPILATELVNKTRLLSMAHAAKKLATLNAAELILSEIV